MPPLLGAVHVRRTLLALAALAATVGAPGASFGFAVAVPYEPAPWALRARTWNS